MRFSIVAIDTRGGIQPYLALGALVREENGVPMAVDWLVRQS